MRLAERESGTTAASPWRTSLGGKEVLLLGGAIALFLLLRSPWIGHLLVWDEAITLLTVRAFKAGAQDAFSEWFWRHPPLYTVLLLLVKPFQSGFAERAEWISVSIAAINQILLFVLNRRIFGNKVALWSAFFIAVLPGAVFFDVWIKPDHPVTTFGLLSLLLLLSNRILYAGLSLGLALLSKETAVFYVGAVILLWMLGSCGKRTWRDFLALTIIPFLASSWWYLVVVSKVASIGAGGETGQGSFWTGFMKGNAMEHFRFALNSEPWWNKSTFFYFTNLPAELSWAGIVLIVLGLVLSVPCLLKRKNTERNQNDVFRAWPACLSLPPLLLLSLLPSKVPWLVIVLFPAWATLCAVAVSEFIAWAQSHLGPSRRFIEPLIAAMLVAGLAFAMIWNSRDYDAILKKVAEGQWRGAHFSSEAAKGMNALVKEGERALITSFHYWQGVSHTPCPIFTYYLEPKLEVLMRRNTGTFEEYVADIQEYGLDWALLSPVPGPAANELLRKFQQADLKYHRFSKAVVFRTTPLYEKQAAASRNGRQ
jgi:4-amino-4-deoxy-L-arabinose transferase-like glycosyltransferase